MMMLTVPSRGLMSTLPTLTPALRAPRMARATSRCFTGKMPRLPGIIIISLNELQISFNAVKARLICRNVSICIFFAGLQRCVTKQTAEQRREKAISPARGFAQS
jgi:hypothetical protein